MLLLAGSTLAVGAGTTGPCQTDAPSGGGYSVELCVTAPADGASVSGDTPVTATVSVTGPSSGVRYVEFSIDGDYVLRDFQAPYMFALPTPRWSDGARELVAAVAMRDGFRTADAEIALDFDNGVDEPAGNGNSFAPAAGIPATPDRPYVLAAVGDGAGGETSATTISDLITGFDPNLFLYLGDVYDKGTPTEFKNWYATDTFGRFKAITNPVPGNHELQAGGGGPGYFDYWDNPPHYYSFDAAGWHFIAIDSTNEFGQSNPGSEQFAWLRDDLAAHADASCTIAYMHHPLWNIGPEGSSTRLADMWKLLHNNGVDIVLTAHDHTYQRWAPLDANGKPSASGMTEFVSGTGGHSQQDFVRSDSRVKIASTGFGALRLELNPRGAAFRHVNMSGVVLDSGSVPCRDLGSDTTAPAVPGAPVAVNLSRSQVDLRWDAVTDDVGVTGYDVYRNGAFLARTGPRPSYADTQVTPGTVYSYTVRARDAAGNISAAGASTQVTIPELETLLYDGFESGTLDEWSVKKNLTVSSADRFSGTFAARALSSGTGTTYAFKNLSPERSQLYMQQRFKVVAKDSKALNLQRFKTSASEKLVSVYLTSTNKLAYRNDVTATSVTSTRTVSLGAWHTLQTHVAVAGTSSHVEVWLDGAPVTGLSNTESLGSTPIGRPEIGHSTANGAYELWIDEVAADPAYIGDVASPSTPGGLTASADSGLRVDLNWDPAIDDVGVSAYEVFRDGQLLASTSGATTYADTTVAPQNSYFYEVRALDAAGNASSRSDLVVIDTPAAFADDFESGDLGAWTTGSGVTVNGGVARFVSSGSPAMLSKTFTATRPEMYVRVRLKLHGAPPQSVQLVRWRTASGVALASLSITSARRLVLRNDTQGTSTTSATELPVDEWREIQMRLNAGDPATGAAEVQLAGLGVDDLDRGESFGSTPIGRLELGDANSGRTFDVSMDDVLVDVDPIADSTPPQAPAGLSATPTGATSVHLEWQPAVDNQQVASYGVFRNGSQVATIEDTHYDDTGLAPETTYTYEVRATDHGANESDASTPVTVTTPGVDGSPPSAPTGLQATATGAQRVELTWLAATDDVAVTQYELQRDGTTIATVDAPSTSFTDTTVASQATYSYRVAALDAAGNRSPLSSPASATTPAQTLFSDGFEAGNLAKWSTVKGNLSVQATHAFTGTYGARATTTNAATYAFASFAPAASVVLRMRVKPLATPGTTAYLGKLRTADNAAVIGLYLTSSGTLSLRNDFAGISSASGATVPAGQWHAIELRAWTGTSSGVETWLDGTRVDALSGPASLGTAPFGRLQLADNLAGRVFDLAFDDVVVEPG